MFVTETPSLVQRQATRVAERSAAAAAATSAARAASPERFSLVGPVGAPVVVVLGGISASRNVVSSAAGRGWWDDIVGNGRAIDTTCYRVLGFDFLDGGRDASGRPRRIVTTHDQARAIAQILRDEGIDELHAFVGSSYGGMVALAFAELFSERLERLVIISAAHESSGMTTALRTLQRRVVELGLDTGSVTDALSIARGIAMTTYRSAAEFAERFSSIPVATSPNDARFEVDGYLRNCGERFAASVRPERFLALSLSADLHRVDPCAISTPCTLVAAEGDSVVPHSQMRELADTLNGPSDLVTIPTLVGHDAFLVETSRVSSILSAALA